MIPALLALIGRLATKHDVHVFALSQEPQPGAWQLRGARVQNIGAGGGTLRRAVTAVASEHRRGRFEVIHSIFSSGPGVVVAAAARWLRVPSVVHVAGGELVALPEIAYGGALKWRSRLRETLVLRGVSCVTAASAPMLEALSLRGIGAQRVPLGVDLAAWPVREPRRRLPDAPARLVQVASLNRVKDQTMLLQALALLQDAGLEFAADLVGEDTLGGELQVLAARLGLGARVTFHGFLTQRELRPLVAAADLMLVSSRHEAGPLAVLEAAVAGVPTVGTAVGHILEWAPTAARAVPVADPVALAQQVLAVLQDEEGRLSLARAAQRLALAQDADYTALQFEQIYARLCG